MAGHGLDQGFRVALDRGEVDEDILAELPS